MIKILSSIVLVFISIGGYGQCPIQDVIQNIFKKDSVDHFIEKYMSNHNHHEFATDVFVYNKIIKRTSDGKINEYKDNGINCLDTIYKDPSKNIILYVFQYDDSILKGELFVNNKKMEPGIKMLQGYSKSSYSIYFEHNFKNNSERIALKKR
jgi:hypothetical protein